MHRIDDVNATPENLFTEGDPIGGTPATKITDDWLNDLQEEVCNLIEAAGITLVKGTRDQLVDAVNALISGYTDPLVAEKMDIDDPNVTGELTVTQGTAGEPVQRLSTTHADGNSSETVYQSTYEGGPLGDQTMLTIPVPTDTSLLIDVSAFGKQLAGTGTNDSYAEFAKAVVRNVSGTVTVRGTPTISSTGDGTIFTSSPGIVFTVSGTNILVQVALFTSNARNVRMTARVYPCG